MLSTIYKQPDKNHIPNHVAIIMDGNGRWAQARKLPRIAGHKKGADSVRNVMEACRDHKVKYLTLYAFSSENWKRPAEEIKDLMSLLRLYLGKELDKLNKNGVCLKVIGNTEKLSEDIRQQINEAEELTKDNKELFLTIAISYGAREEMVRAAKLIADKAVAGKLKTSDINEEVFENYLYTAKMPEPDLLIRTGGEQRLSNFLLWQFAYTELFFTDVLWPDFGKDDFSNAISEFTKRERRYGTF